MAEQEPEVRPVHQPARLPGRDGRDSRDAEDEHQDAEEPQAEHQGREPRVDVQPARRPRRGLRLTHGDPHDAQPRAARTADGGK